MFLIRKFNNKNILQIKHLILQVGCTLRLYVSSNTETIEAGFYSKATPWHGVKARFGIWEIPDVKPHLSSGSYIAAINDYPALEIIAAGFHVCHCIFLFILSYRLPSIY